MNTQAPESGSVDTATPRHGFSWLLDRTGSFGIDRQILKSLMYRFSEAKIGIRLWDGRVMGETTDADTQLILHTRHALWKLAMDPLDHLPELYVSGEIDIVGDILQFLRVINEQMLKDAPRLSGRVTSALGMSRYGPILRAATRGRLPDIECQQADFFRHWLDPEMFFSSAEFTSSRQSLDEAQLAKCHAICRQLHLQPGETVFEIGGGWGGFALFAAREYGVRVRSFSPVESQIEYARNQAEQAGLENRVEFVLANWNEISGSCDAVVCIEALEVIDSGEYSDVGAIFRKCLGQQGRGLVQTVGRNSRQAPEAHWIEQHLWPFNQPPALSQLMELFEYPGLTVCSLENLRPHYQRTLSAWRENLDESTELLRSQFDDPILRSWKLYLAAMQAAFESSALQLFRMTFSASGACLFGPSAGNNDAVRSSPV